MKDFRHYIFLISGYSKTGKDEFALSLIGKHGATKIGMIDVPRRHMMEIFHFTKEQVFGASQHRNRGDLRYKKPIFHHLGVAPWNEMASKKYQILMPDNKTYYYCILGRDKFEAEVSKHSHLFPNRDYIQAYKDVSISGDRIGLASHRVLFIIEEGDPVFWLSPREALQIHCGALQDLYENVWVEKFVQTQVGWFATMRPESPDSRLSHALVSNPFDYNQAEGFISIPRYWVSDVIIVSSDIRHRHEIRYVKEHAEEFGYIPVGIRMKRPGVTAPPFQHRSELELATIPDSAFDFVVNNDGTVEDLHHKADLICRAVTAPGWSSAVTVRDMIPGISIE
jgi:hypothetical protein